MFIFPPIDLAYLSKPFFFFNRLSSQTHLWNENEDQDLLGVIDRVQGWSSAEKRRRWSDEEKDKTRVSVGWDHSDFIYFTSVENPTFVHTILLSHWNTYTLSTIGTIYPGLQSKQKYMASLAKAQGVHPKEKC